MLSITSKSPYAVRALVELHRYGDVGPTPIAELARRGDIPVQFLEQLFATLRRAGLLRSQRGVKGGYTFARPAEQITVLEVVELLDGPLGQDASGVFPAGRGSGPRGPGRVVDRRHRGRRGDGRRAPRCTTSDPTAKAYPSAASAADMQPCRPAGRSLDEHLTATCLPGAAPTCDESPILAPAPSGGSSERPA